MVDVTALYRTGKLLLHPRQVLLSILELILHSSLSIPQLCLQARELGDLVVQGVLRLILLAFLAGPVIPSLNSHLSPRDCVLKSLPPCRDCIEVSLEALHPLLASLDLRDVRARDLLPFAHAVVKGMEGGHYGLALDVHALLL